MFWFIISYRLSVLFGSGLGLDIALLSLSSSTTGEDAEVIGKAMQDKKTEHASAVAFRLDECVKEKSFLLYSPRCRCFGSHTACTTSTVDTLLLYGIVFFSGTTICLLLLSCGSQLYEREVLTVTFWVEIFNI